LDSSAPDDLYQKIFFEYGDDSVAQLGGVHLACEQASNLLTKVLERGRLMSYLEQSTRYLGYDRRLPNGLYRFYRDNDLLESRFGARYIGEMDRMFDTYRELLPVLTDWLALKYPKTPEDTDFVYRQAIRAKALDGLRGLCRLVRSRIWESTRRARPTSHCCCACERTRYPRYESTPS
jgi:thymidylate synthase ThyX